MEHYGHTEWSDYPTWMPLEGAAYYGSQREAQEALDALVEHEYQRSVAAHEKDVRECAERAAVYEKAATAVEGMPQAHIISRSYRTTTPWTPKRCDNLYRVARVTSFQERIQALLDATRSEQVDVDDLRGCFVEGADPTSAAASSQHAAEERP